MDLRIKVKDDMRSKAIKIGYNVFNAHTQQSILIDKNSLKDTYSHSTATNISRMSAMYQIDDLVKNAAMLNTEVAAKNNDTKTATTVLMQNRKQFP